MDYYNDLIKKIEKLIQEEKIIEARNLIYDELKVPYVPRDIMEKLESFLDDIGYVEYKKEDISDEELINYLKGDNDHQLIAVNILDKKNLRDYISLCEDYLCSDGFINAKVLLIDSLIRQEISNEIKMKDDTAEYEFIPKYIIPVELSDGFLSGNKLLEDIFMKDPSKYKLAKELLYKETIMKLPMNLESNEGIELTIDIIKYIYKAYDDAEGLNKFIELEESIRNNKNYYLY